MVLYVFLIQVNACFQAWSEDVQGIVENVLSHVEKTILYIIMKDYL